MLRKAKRLPAAVMLVLIIVFLGSLSGCGDSADPLGTGIIQFYDVSSELVITTTSVDPGGNVTLTVRVRNLRSDGSLAPVIGERVTFTLLTPANGGGLTVVNERTAGNGQAMAVFTAGNNSAIDSVRATTSTGSTATITITKTGGIVGARIASILPVSATVAAGQTVAITATVTDGNNNPMMGEPVTFTVATNSSGGSFFNTGSINATVNTDAGGNALVVYQAGSGSLALEVYDTILATLTNGSRSAVTVTRSAPAPVVPGTPLSLSVAASPTSVSAGQISIVTATLTGTNNAGVTVTFSVPLNNSGATLSSTTAITDGAGNAVVSYTAGSNNATLTVYDTVQAAVGTATTSAVITRTGASATAYSITVSATPNPLSLIGGSSVVTANVQTSTGTAVSGVLVTFSTSAGAVSPLTATTDGSGNASTVLTGTAGGAGATAAVVTASISVGGSPSASVVITNP